MPPLQTVRLERQLSQRALADKAKVRLETVYFIETGRRKPRLHVMRQICIALEVDPQEVDEFRMALTS